MASTGWLQSSNRIFIKTLLVLSLVLQFSGHQSRCLWLSYNFIDLLYETDVIRNSLKRQFRLQNKILKISGKNRIEKQLQFEGYDDWTDFFDLISSEAARVISHVTEIDLYWQYAWLIQKQLNLKQTLKEDNGGQCRRDLLTVSDYLLKLLDKKQKILNIRHSCPRAEHSLSFLIISGGESAEFTETKKNRS